MEGDTPTENGAPTPPIPRGTVNMEQATKEVEMWLDAKRIKETKRENNDDSITRMIEAVADGSMVLDHETMHWTVNLAFPLGDNEGKKTLKVRPRITVRDINTYMKGVKPTDASLRVQAYMACITEETRGVIGGLDTSDYELMQAIVIFFL